MEIENEEVLYCDESMSSTSTVSEERNRWTVRKEDKRWHLGTYHLRRAIGTVFAREDLWIKTLMAVSDRGRRYLSGIPSSIRYKTLYFVTDRIAPMYIEEARRANQRVEFKLPVDNEGSTMWQSLGNNHE